MSFLNSVENWLEKEKGIKDIYKMISVKQERIKSGYCETCYDVYDTLVIKYEGLSGKGGEDIKTITIDIDFNQFVTEVSKY